MQEITLAGLYRRRFFSKAAVCGGTCRRIFHQLPRFSEDLDFSLLQPTPDFSLQPYLRGPEEEFAALGINVKVNVKYKNAQSAIVSAFLKTTTTVAQLAIGGTKMLKIKLEVDTDPPRGFNTEEQQRVKGRDWFDLEWYVRQGIPVHLDHLAERARQSGHLHQQRCKRCWLSASSAWMYPCSA